MLFPKIIILAPGGAHGDFLTEVCRLMVHNTKVNMNLDGKVYGTSVLKGNIFFKNDRYTSISREQLEKLNLKTVELSHVWYDTFIDWPSKFFYISVDKKYIPIVSKMDLEKNHKGNKQAAVNNYLNFLPNDLKKNLSKKKIEWFDFSKSVITRAEKKYIKQPQISAIKITDLYDLEKLQEQLIKMNCYDVKKQDILKQVHCKWLKNNEKYIAEIFKIDNNK